MNIKYELCKNWTFQNIYFDCWNFWKAVPVARLFRALLSHCIAAEYKVYLKLSCVFVSFIINVNSLFYFDNKERTMKIHVLHKYKLYLSCIRNVTTYTRHSMIPRYCTWSRLRCLFFVYKPREANWVFLTPTRKSESLISTNISSHWLRCYLFHWNTSHIKRVKTVHVLVQNNVFKASLGSYQGPHSQVPGIGEGIIIRWINNNSKTYSQSSALLMWCYVLLCPIWWATWQLLL